MATKVVVTQERRIRKSIQTMGLVASRVGEVLRKWGKKPSLLEGWVDADNQGAGRHRRPPTGHPGKTGTTILCL